MMSPRTARQRDRLLLAVGATLAGLLIPAPALRAQEGGLATVETESGAGPQDVPGRDKGERSRTGADADIKPPTPAPSPPEPGDWFGGKHWWEWSTATGNWGGIRTSLDDHGLAFAGSFVLDWSSVWSGGVQHRASTRSLTDFNLTLDTQKFVGLEGGTFFVDFYSTDGRGGSEHAGDFQGISNIQTDENLDQIAEVWYEQWLFDRRLRIKLGKVDANSEFAFASAAGTFLNSAAGVSPPIFVLPTYPDPASSVNVFVYPTDSFYLGFGIYDGATADGFRTGGRGPATFFSDSRSGSWFFIGEAGLTWKTLGSMGAGRVAAGGWGHTADFARFDGGVEEGTQGCYVCAEQQLIMKGQGEDDAEKGLFVFAKYAWADEHLCECRQSVGAGCCVRGTFGDRSDDEAGLFVGWADLSGDPAAGFAGDETTVELYYKVAITPFFSLTPDLQYIVNPSGDPSISDAVVGAVRFELTF